MAVNQDQDFVSELPEGADMMLFAEDLVDYILLQSHSSNYHLEWEPITFRDHVYNAFIQIIGNAIFYIDKNLETFHKVFFSEIKIGNFLNSDSYEKFVKILAEEYFSEGFDAKYFLIYCVNLSKMANSFYSHGINSATDLAKIHIYRILQKYDVLVEEWLAILSIAEICDKSVRCSKNEITPPEISIILYEIEEQDWKQLQSVHEPNFPQEWKESFLSINTESNNERQKERAYSKIKIYMKKYAQYASKCKSEVGLCSVKESAADTSPKIVLEGNKLNSTSDSDNKPTPGTSNTDEELISIISFFKKQLDEMWNEIEW